MILIWFLTDFFSLISLVNLAFIAFTFCKLVHVYRYSTLTSVLRKYTTCKATASSSCLFDFYPEHKLAKKFTHQQSLFHPTWKQSCQEHQCLTFEGDLTCCLSWNQEQHNNLFHRQHWTQPSIKEKKIKNIYKRNATVKLNTIFNSRAC